RSRERPTINSAASDEVWLLKSCQYWSTSRVGHLEDFEFARAASLAWPGVRRPFFVRAAIGFLFFSPSSSTDPAAIFNPREGRRRRSRHFQERVPYGLFVPDVPDATHWRGMCYAHQFSREGSLCVREAAETAPDPWWGLHKLNFNDTCCAGHRNNDI